MNLAVLLFLAAVVTGRPQNDALERRFPIPNLGEVAVGEKPTPVQQIHIITDLFTKPTLRPPPSFFRPLFSEVPLVSTPVDEGVNSPVFDAGFVFSSEEVPSPQVVEIEPVVQASQNSPRQGAGLIGQGFHQTSDRDAHVIRQDRLEPSPDGSAGVSYETSNGINVVSRTSLDQDGFNVVEGSYSYISTDGVPVHVRYIADRNGFRYTGRGLPVGPEIPPHAQEQIERGKRLHEEAARRRAEQRGQ